MKFKNKNTGLIEIITNEFVLKQYKKYSDIYEEVKDNKKESKEKSEKVKDNKKESKEN